MCDNEPFLVLNLISVGITVDLFFYNSITLLHYYQQYYYYCNHYQYYYYYHVITLISLLSCRTQDNIQSNFFQFPHYNLVTCQVTWRISLAENRILLTPAQTLNHYALLSILIFHLSHQTIYSKLVLNVGKIKLRCQFNGWKN